MQSNDILIYLLSELRGFKSLTTLVLEFKKIEDDVKTNYSIFLIWTQKQRQLSMKVMLIIYLNQFMLRLYHTQKNLWEKVQVELLIQLSVLLLIFQSAIPYLAVVISNY